MRKKIGILGSTGSIGTQALEVVRANPAHFEVLFLTAGRNVDLLIAQALEFRPQVVVIADPKAYSTIQTALDGTGIQVMAGASALEEVVQMPEINLVLTAMVGFAGLAPTLSAINAGKDIALANKETLVVAGSIITRLAREKGVQLLPVDSEHSAIFQCLFGEKPRSIEKIYLTASGGPFRGWERQRLIHVKKEQALKHPNWVMGAKITIDSASMMNKGLEVIEAKWLFELETDQIEVLVHPQSIVHSMVQFVDGSIMAQLGLPDMKLPIQVAMAYPERIRNNFQRLNFMDYPNLTFEQVDTQVFRNLALAYESIQMGGNMPCVLNAANEVMVEAFLQDKVGFLQMSDIIAETMERVPFIGDLSLDSCQDSDKEARRIAFDLIS